MLSISSVTLNESGIIGNADRSAAGRACGPAGLRVNIPESLKSSFRSEFLEFLDISIVLNITKMIIAMPIQAARYEYIIIFKPGLNLGLTVIWAWNSEIVQFCSR